MSIYCSGLGFGSDGWAEQPADAPIVYRKSHVLPSMIDPRGGTLELATIPPWITRDGRCLAGRHCDPTDDHAGCCEYQQQRTHWPYLRVALQTSEYPDGEEWAELCNLAESVEIDNKKTANLLRRVAAPEYTIILDRNQVTALRDTLTEWLNAAPEEPK